MKRFLIPLILSLVASFAAWALPASQLSPASWVYPYSMLDMDAQANRVALYGKPAGTLTSLLSITRASVAYEDGTDGIWRQFGSGVIRQTDKGILAEAAATNNALWSRDMTNAAWVKVNMTTAQTATGIDGVANSATTLTASAGNATVLQTVVLGSAAEDYSVWLKRISGSGVVNISADGILWTAVAITTTWTRFPVTQTLANPSVGVQIVTSGDSVAADFSQLETGSNPSSPILTTTVAATRALDVITFNPAVSVGGSVTLLVKATPNISTATAGTLVYLSVDDSTTNNRINVARATGAGLFQVVSGGSTLHSASTGTLTQYVSAKWGGAATAADQQGVVAGTLDTGTTAAGFPTGLTAVHIGLRGDGSSATSCSCYFERGTIIAIRQPNGILTGNTQ